MRYTPEANGTTGKRLAVGFLAAGIICFTLAGIQAIPFHSVLQTASFLLIVEAIFLLVRFGMRSYSYAVERDEDTLSGAYRDAFHVDELSKNSAYTVARLWLDDLESVELYTKARKREWKSKIYVYLTDVAVKESYLLTFRDGEMNQNGAKIYLRIELDDELRSLLEARAASNREGA